MEACCRPWTWWCNDATALAGCATMMMMISGQDVLRYSNKNESVGFNNARLITNKLISCTVVNVSPSFAHKIYKMAAKNSWHKLGTKLRHCQSFCLHGRPKSCTKFKSPKLQPNLYSQKLSEHFDEIRWIDIVILNSYNVFYFLVLLFYTF